jgi:transcriptional regulator with XRE-family HTH domain
LNKKRNIREVLASNLKEYRRKLGFTQEKLAEMANVSIHYISMIETCNKYPKPEMVERLAKILGIESYKLFSVEEETNEPLERLHHSIIRDVKLIVKEAVDEIKSAEYKPRRKNKKKV